MGQARRRAAAVAKPVAKKKPAAKPAAGKAVGKAPLPRRTRTTKTVKVPELDKAAPGLDTENKTGPRTHNLRFFDLLLVCLWQWLAFCVLRCPCQRGRQGIHAVDLRRQGHHGLHGDLWQGIHVGDLRRQHRRGLHVDLRRPSANTGFNMRSLHSCGCFWNGSLTPTMPPLKPRSSGTM